MINMLVLMAFVMLIGIAFSGCGTHVDGERKLKIVEETITCTSDTTCSNDRLICQRINYYSQEWHCTLILDED